MHSLLQQNQALRVPLSCFGGGDVGGQEGQASALPLTSGFCRNRSPSWRFRPRGLGDREAGDAFCFASLKTVFLAIAPRFQNSGHRVCPEWACSAHLGKLQYFALCTCAMEMASAATSLCFAFKLADFPPSICKGAQNG